MFNRSAQWSVPIVVALIFITTGEVRCVAPRLWLRSGWGLAHELTGDNRGGWQAEFWVFDACSVPSQVTEIMGPNLACFSDWG